MLKAHVYRFVFNSHCLNSCSPIICLLCEFICINLGRKSLKGAPLQLQSGILALRESVSCLDPTLFSFFKSSNENNWVLFWKEIHFSFYLSGSLPGAVLRAVSRCQCCLSLRFFHKGRDENNLYSLRSWCPWIWALGGPWENKLISKLSRANVYFYAEEGNMQAGISAPTALLLSGEEGKGWFEKSLWIHALACDSKARLLLCETEPQSQVATMIQG